MVVKQNDRSQGTQNNGIQAVRVMGGYVDVTGSVDVSGTVDVGTIEDTVNVQGTVMTY